MDTGPELVLPWLGRLWRTAMLFALLGTVLLLASSWLWNRLGSADYGFGYITGQPLTPFQEEVVRVLAWLAYVVGVCLSLAVLAVSLALLDRSWPLLGVRIVVTPLVAAGMVWLTKVAFLGVFVFHGVFAKLHRDWLLEALVVWGPSRAHLRRDSSLARLVGQ